MSLLLFTRAQMHDQLGAGRIDLGTQANSGAAIIVSGWELDVHTDGEDADLLTGCGQQAPLELGGPVLPIRRKRRDTPAGTALTDST